MGSQQEGKRQEKRHHRTPDAPERAGCKRAARLAREKALLPGRIGGGKGAQVRMLTEDCFKQPRESADQANRRKAACSSCISSRAFRVAAP